MSNRERHRHWGWSIAIVLLALVLRVMSWGQNRFMEDEALYAAWGLQIASGTDPMLDYEPVDKPPLYPYTLALSFTLFGLAHPDSVAADWLKTEHQMEMAARLPNLFASVAAVALVYALGRRLGLEPGDERVGLVAALLVAISPFDILFASTAFTDPLLCALVPAAFLAACSGRPGAAGLLSGLAWATKQQGLLFLPLIVAAMLLAPGRAGSPAEKTDHRLRRIWAQPWVRLTLGFGAVVGAAFWWDSARAQRPGFWTQALVSYGSLGLAGPEVWGERARDWLHLAGDLWVSPWLNGLLLAVLAAWAIVTVRTARVREAKSRIQKPQRRVWDVVLLIFVVCFLAVHWLVTFQVWDRYLLGLVPIVALLAARAVVGLSQLIPSRSWRMVSTVGLGLVVLAALVGPLSRAARSEMALGGDHGAYDGIDRLAAYVRAEVPSGAVLYHHWLGYHYRFYLYGAPLRQHWYPDPSNLVQDAIQYRREPRFVAFPSFRDGTPMRQALEEAGVRLQLVYQATRRDGSTSFELYRLDGPSS